MPRFLKEYLETKSVVMRPYNKNLKLPSRDSRNNMTDAEQMLWQRLRCKQILGLQFFGRNQF
jgi:very-short-patch-repair endonuclease